MSFKKIKTIEKYNRRKSKNIITNINTFQNNIKYIVSKLTSKNSNNQNKCMRIK
jgi:hypothetical protein